MLRLLVLAVVATAVVVLADNANYPEQYAPSVDQPEPVPASNAPIAPMQKWKANPVEDQKTPMEIITRHIPASIGSLGLTTGDLKLFAGHALNLLKSKCPNVNHHTIFKMHKYIGKRIMESNPVAGDNQKLRSLLDKMMVCAAKGPKPKVEETKKVEPAAASDPEKKDQPDSKPTPDAENKASAPAPAPATPKKKWSEMTIEERAAEIGSLFTHNEPKKPEDQAAPATVSPKPTVVTTEKPQARRNPVMGWLANVMESISSFFRGVFGFGRGRRSADGQEGSGSPRFVFTFWRNQPDQNEDKKSMDKLGGGPGNRAFLTLFDQMCRIYCDMCPGPNQSIDFKIATKELLQFLLKEDSTTGIDLAAEHYLNHEFLQSVLECV